MPGPEDEEREELQPTRPTFRARLRGLMWPAGSPEAQTAINHPSGLGAATSVSHEATPASDRVHEPDAPAPAPVPAEPVVQAAPNPDSASTDAYNSYAAEQAAKEPQNPVYDQRADNPLLREMLAGERSPHAQAGQRPSQNAPDEATTVQTESPSAEPPPQVDTSKAETDRLGQVRAAEPAAAREVTEDRRASEPPPNPTEPTPPEPQELAAAESPVRDARDFTGREGQAASSSRFNALKSGAASEQATDLDAWAAEQIPVVARDHFEMWREADVAAVHAVEHMQTSVPNRSQDVETRLTGLATEVRHGFHQARTGLDLIENPTPATLSAFMAHAHHESTPDLLKTATPQEVPAIVIADSATLNADLGDSIDALDAAISDLAHDEARQLRGASVVAPANDSAAAPIIRDERPTFTDLTDARLDDINAILEEARSNDNREGAPIATVLTAAAVQTFHRLSAMEGMAADTPEHERAADVTREDISSLIATVADAREVRVTDAQFANVVAQDETALAAMLALSTPSAEGAHEASAAGARHLAEFESLTGEMTEAKWDHASARALAEMEEMSDYKAEATEKNASRARNSGRDAGAER